MGHQMLIRRDKNISSYSIPEMTYFLHKDYKSSFRGKVLKNNILVATKLFNVENKE